MFFTILGLISRILIIGLGVLPFRKNKSRKLRKLKEESQFKRFKLKAKMFNSKGLQLNVRDIKEEKRFN